MLKVATHANAACIDVKCGDDWASLLIVERNSIVHPVAYCLYPAPPWLDISEEVTSNSRKAIHLAISAIEQIREHFVRQVAYGDLLCGQINLIRTVRIMNQG